MRLQLASGVRAVWRGSALDLGGMYYSKGLVSELHSIVGHSELVSVENWRIAWCEKTTHLASEVFCE